MCLHVIYRGSQSTTLCEDRKHSYGSDTCRCYLEGDGCLGRETRTKRLFFVMLTCTCDAFVLLHSVFTPTRTGPFCVVTIVIEPVTGVLRICDMKKSGIMCFCCYVCTPSRPPDSARRRFPNGMMFVSHWYDVYCHGEHGRPRTTDMYIHRSRSGPHVNTGDYLNT